MRILITFFLFLAFYVSEAGAPSPGLSKYRFPFELNEDEERFWDRVRFGGNLGLQFGNPTNIIISPSLGYIPKGEKLANRLMVGIGITYMYNKWRYVGYSYESNIYGGREFLRYLVFQNIFAYTEHEILNAPVYNDLSSNRQWVNSLFVGAGYLQQFSGRGGIMITVLYNLAWTINNPIYSSPWNFRVGFML